MEGEHPSVAVASARGHAQRGAIPELLWSPLAAAVLTIIAGLIGFAFGHPWLFPSLGPTAYMHAVEPQHPTSRAYNTVIGHLIGTGAAYLCVWVFQVSDEPSVLAADTVPLGRVFASTVAIALVIVGQLLTRSRHPPAAATVLLITLGGFGWSWHALVSLVAGVGVVASAGSLVRTLRLMQPGQR